MELVWKAPMISTMLVQKKMIATMCLEEAFTSVKDDKLNIIMIIMIMTTKSTIMMIVVMVKIRKLLR